MRTVTLLLLITTGLAACGRDAPEEAFGAYRLADGAPASVRESVSDTVRLTLFASGETRRFERDGDIWRAVPSHLADRLSKATLHMTANGFELETGKQAVVRATRVDLRTSVVDIASYDGVRLHTRLTLPAGPGPHPMVVLAHGSGGDAATRTYASADLFPMYGVASLVYDKRGTGRSEGEYDMDFHQLARDLLAVTAWGRSEPGIDANRVGVAGYSQGGWIGPLAAHLDTENRLSWVVVNFGMIDSPREESRLETLATLKARGVGAAGLEAAERLNHAVVDILASDFERGWENFHSLRASIGDAPWLEETDGTLIEPFLAWPEWVVRIAGPFMNHPGLPWDYDSRPALDALAARGVPVVYIIAELDTSAPPAFTRAEIARRIELGHPIALEVIPGTDHGYVLIHHTDSGQRLGNLHPDAPRIELNWVRRFAGLAPLHALD